MRPGVFQQMSFLDRFLPVWIIGAMVIGVVCGYYVPDLAQKLSVVSIQGTSLPIAIGLWLMMWPVLAKVPGPLPIRHWPEAWKP